MLHELKNPAAANGLRLEIHTSHRPEGERKNNRLLFPDVLEVPIMMATKFPTTMMVVGEIGNLSDAVTCQNDNKTWTKLAAEVRLRKALGLAGL